MDFLSLPTSSLLLTAFGVRLVVQFGSFAALSKIPAVLGAAPRWEQCAVPVSENPSG